MRLVLSRAECSDFDQMVPLAFRSFEDDPMLPVFFGHESPESLAHVKESWIKGTKESSDIWMKVVDLDGGDIEVDWIHASHMTSGGEGEVARVEQERIVGACNWRVYPTYVAPKDEQKKPIDEEYAYLPTHQERLDASHILTEYMADRHAEVAEPHVLCYLLFVDPEYHGKGVGKTLMRWGNEVAASLMLPVWLESSKKGEGLYRTLGFEETSRKAWETKSFGRCNCLRMRRCARVQSWEWEGKGGIVKKMG